MLGAVAGGVIIMCSLVAMLILSGDRMPELVIGGTPVDREEYLEAVSDARFEVKGYFRETYDADTGGDFWTETFGEETPYKKTADVALRELCRRYAVYQTAEEKGYIGTYSYKDMEERVRKENEERKNKQEAGEVIYGLSEYSLSQFLDYEMSSLQEMYCNDDSNEDMEVTEEELKEYYDNGGAIVGEDGVTIPLDEVKNAVKYEIQKQRYEEMIEKKANDLSIETDREKLYEFTLDHLK